MLEFKNVYIRVMHIHTYNIDIYKIPQFHLELFYFTITISLATHSHVRVKCIKSN